MSCAQKHLRVIDVLDKKNRIERQREAKKDQIREEQMHAHQRINTLLNLKDQIVRQRKARIFQQSSLKSRALNIKSIPTGPGQYDIDRDKVLNEIPAPKMPKLSKYASEPSLLLSDTGPPPGKERDVRRGWELRLVGILIKINPYPFCIPSSQVPTMCTSSRTVRRWSVRRIDRSSSRKAPCRTLSRTTSRFFATYPGPGPTSTPSRDSTSSRERSCSNRRWLP